MNATRCPALLCLRPHLESKIWGGERLKDRLPKLSLDGPVGESLEASDLPGQQSLIADGPLAGRPLSEAIDTYGADLLGDDSGQLPIVLKLIDARDDLSVQVHPTHAAAADFDGAHAKDEAWWVLDTDEGASLLHGFASDCDADSFADAVRSGEPEKQLRRLAVGANDVLHVPPGTPHAICRGMFVLEVTERSSTTFRVWDYERPGLDGKPRELHVDQAMASFDFESDAPDVVRRPEAAGYAKLVATPAFTLDSLTVAPEAPVKLAEKSRVRVVHVVHGSLRLSTADQQIVLKRHETALIAACADTVTASAEQAETVVCIAAPGSGIE